MHEKSNFALNLGGSQFGKFGKYPEIDKNKILRQSCTKYIETMQHLKLKTTFRVVRKCENLIVQVPHPSKND